MGKNRSTSESKATGGGAKQDALLPPVRGHTPALIALYWPNIVTYYRVVLVFGCVALHALEWHGLFIVVYAVASVLDALDGYLARLFVQATKYGEVLDVVVDIVQRSLLWSLVGANTKSLEPVVFAVIGLEWMTFAVMHARSMLVEGHWKNMDTSMPRWLQYMFSNGFRNPLGAVAIGGTFFAPLYLYARAYSLLPSVLTPDYVLYAVCASKALAMAAEVFLVKSYMYNLLVVHSQLIAQAQALEEEGNKAAAKAGKSAKGNKSN